MLFLKEKQAKLLTTLANTGREWHITDLSKEAGVTYIHTSKFIAKCEEHGIVASERHGRVKKLMLTKKGEEIVKDIASIIEKTRQDEQKPAQQQK